MKRFVPALLALVLTGCGTAGADYHGPQSALPAAPVAKGAFVSGGNKAFADQPVPGQWWQLYADPRLDALVSEALAANTDLRVAAANIELAQAQLREAQVNRQVQTITGGGVALARPNGSNDNLPGQLGYDAGLSVSYEVDLVGRLRRLIEAAAADAGAVQAAYDLTRVTVVANVVAAYARVCTAGYQRVAAQRSLMLQQESLGITERLIRAGRGTALDRSRAEALVEQLRAAIPGFDADRQNALFRLATLTGHAPADFAADLSGCMTPPRLSSPIPVGDGAALIRRRPDIREAERAVAAASARIGVATADLYPRIALGGSVNLAGPFSQFGSGSSFGFSLGPLISWSFPNRSIARARIAQTEAVERAELARFDGAVLNALRETESALTAYAYELDRNAALRVARDRAATATEQANRLYRYGREGYLTVLDAQRTLASAEATLAASDALLAQYQVAVFLALGGGWEQTG